MIGGENTVILQPNDYMKYISEEEKKCPEITNIVQAYVLKMMSSNEITPQDKESFFAELARNTDTLNKKIYFLSVALSAQKSIDIFFILIDMVWNNKQFIPLDTLNFLLWQFFHYIFAYPELNNSKTKSDIWSILNYNTMRYESVFVDMLNPIPSKERNDKFVLVLTDQFISIKHGPSKTAADRCKILIERMGKKVLLLNTAELAGKKGGIPFFGCFHASYNDGLRNIDAIEWKSCIIPYFQCDNIMPDNDIIRLILSMIRTQKPSYIISIGRGGIIAALASRIIPTLNIGLSPSELDITSIKYQTLSRCLNNNDKALLASIGKSETSIIIGTFGSSIIEQQTSRTREGAGLPSEVWLAALVGGRLNNELTSDFWAMAEKASSYGLEYVIIGSYDQSSLDNTLSQYPTLIGKIHNMGFVTDVLSYLDLCDLYINPIRIGGGTSCVEALSIGIPVITTDLGDVAINAGEQFQTATYDTMLDLIRKYVSDFEFYKSQSLLARERATKLLNAEDSFIEIINEFLDRVKRNSAHNLL